MPTGPKDDEIKEFLKMYEGILPNPQNYPESFKYYWKIFQYYKGKIK